MNVRVAVVGTPCSGTKYVSDCLKHVGLDVEHEGMGRDGISCGFVLFDIRRYPFTWDSLQPEHTVRLLRHPLSVAETLPHAVIHVVQPEHPQPWKHDDPVLAALRWWVLAQEKMPASAHLMRVGTPHLEDDWIWLLSWLGTGRYAPLADIPVQPASKRQRWPRLTWWEWEKRDPEYATRAQPYMEMLGAR